jgi:hypothetical protein
MVPAPNSQGERDEREAPGLEPEQSTCAPDRRPARTEAESSIDGLVVGRSESGSHRSPSHPLSWGGGSLAYGPGDDGGHAECVQRCFSVRRSQGALLRSSAFGLARDLKGVAVA